MAERVIRQLIDDLDGTDITDGDGETVEFSLRDRKYRIDLSPQNVAKLEKALNPFIEAAAAVSTPRKRSTRNAEAKTKPGRRRATKASRSRRSAKTTQSEIRAWANDNGHQVSAKGRLPADVVAAYEAAHNG